MAKYYVECDEFWMVISGKNPRDAALRALRRWRASDQCGQFDERVLGRGVCVDEQGFRRRDDDRPSSRFATFELIAEIQGVTEEELLENCLNRTRSSFRAA